MELAFQEKRLRDLCEEESLAREELGEQAANLLMHRIADMRAATSVQDLVAGSPRETKGPTPPLLLISLGDRYRIRIAANHVTNPLTPSGAVEWIKVRRVKIVAIEVADE